MRIPVVLLVAALLAHMSPASASPPPHSYRFRVSPKIRTWLASPRIRGERDPAVGEVLAPISIRFARPPSSQALRQLRRAGVQFFPGHGEEPLHLGLFYPGRCTARGLRALERSPASLIRQVDLDALLQQALPLDFTGPLVQAPETWTQPTEGLTGKGMTIGSIDSGVDIYHPAFFRADGGLYAWIDVNHNNRFDAGVDAVDLDGDGKAGPKEVLRFFDARVFNVYTQKVILSSDNKTFEPDLDWLYADTNGNQQRDYGAQAGFDDKTPTFGEPLFVAEDLDHNGQLDPQEKLVALGSSKVKATSFDGVERLRGKDLTLTEARAEASHGTATSGILLGGQRGYLRRVGLVPDADLLMAATPTQRQIPLSTLIIWLSQSKADVMLHEYAPWTGYHLDGSSNHESLMDQASQLGIAQVVPAGNLGGADKHMRTDVPAGAVTDIPFVVPGPTGYGTHHGMVLTMLWRDPSADLEFTLRAPNGTEHVLPYDNTSGAAWGDGTTFYYSYRLDSPRGTALMDIYVIGQSGSQPAPIAQGSWTLSVNHPGATGSTSLLGYLSDYITGWGKGVAFTHDVSEHGLVCFPATADSAVTVAAYAGHVGLPYERNPGTDKTGDLRRYSGRGVRIDGAAIMDLAAPDNPITPLNESIGFCGLGAYWVFGGTSGAGPHVAAAALLVKQHQPALDGLGVRDVLRQGALVDAQVGTVPSETWGHGKLRIYHSIHGSDPQPNTPPTATIVAPQKIYVGVEVALDPQVGDTEDKADKLKIRWDVGYDGSWDIPFGPAQPLTRTFDAEGWVRFKLQVEDSGGLRGEAAVLLQVLPASQQPDAGVDGGPTADDGGGCGCAVSSGTGRDHSRANGWLLLLLGLLISRARGAGAVRPR